MFFFLFSRFFLSCASSITINQSIYQYINQYINTDSRRGAGGYFSDEWISSRSSVAQDGHAQGVDEFHHQGGVLTRVATEQ
jgi:hypothetical protein